MSSRSPKLLALSLLLGVPALALAEPFPSTTDEARALAGRTLPTAEAPRPAPPGAIASTTDEARALAGRTLPRAEPAPARAIRAVGSTDEARAVAGGQLVVAPAAAARHPQVASCGTSCDCGHRG